MDSANDQVKSVGFAGLGAMGFGIATNLLKAGFQVNGFDVNPKALTNFTKLGGLASITAGEASRDQNKYFVMVATPGQVDSVVFGADGLLKALSQNAILCLLSTLPPDYVLGLRARLDESGRQDVKLVDCPVSGGVVGANAGTLTIMLGGPEDVLKEIEPELMAISAPGRLFNCGALGSASVAKMLNQHLAGVHIVVAAETIAFAKAMGLSSRVAYDILANSEAASWIMRDRGISMLNADWSPKSAVNIFTKDLGIVTGTADNLSLPCAIASVALEAFVERAARGFGRDDDASVVCNYEDITGKSVNEPREDDSLPSPPAENDTARQVLVIVNDENSELAVALHAAKQNGIFAISGSDESLPLRLPDLPEGSIVAVPCLVGLDERLEQLQANYPPLSFVDYHTVRSSNTLSLQFLFSTDHESIAPILKEVMPQSISTIHVSGPVGSASAMYLAVRLGSLLHLAATAECYSLAVAKGVSSNLVYNLISGAAGSNEQFNQEFPRMQNSNFVLSDNSKSIALNGAMQDMATIRQTMSKINYPGRMFNAAYQIFKSAHRTHPDGDVSAAVIVNFWKQ